MTRPPYRDGRVHVLSEKCSTCIFRPGNLMHLNAGRVKDMVDTSVAEGGVITCHKTLYDDQAVCRGFYDGHGTRVPALWLAARTGVLAEVPPPG